MHGGNQHLDLLFLGSGNAFGPGGRAFSSFLLNGRYLFDCGPTVLQQLQKSQVSSHAIELVLISHFHGDHFFGLPFLFLDGKYGGRSEDICIVGPPGIEEQTEALLRLGYPNLTADKPMAFRRRYVEVADGFEAEFAGLKLTAAAVDHVPEMESFAFRVEIGGQALVYSGDTTLCPGLLSLVKGADVVVLECSCDGVPVHLSPAGVEQVARHAPGAELVVTHLDGLDHPNGFAGLHVADDLKRFVF